MSSILSMKIPNLLVIGGMKCGSTSIVSHLGIHSRVYVSEVKEPHYLCKKEVSDDGVRALYEQLYRDSGDVAWRVDGSTGYSKKPAVKGIAERAQRVLGDVKIVYAVRNPVDRLLSHHYHCFREGKCSGDLQEAIVECPELVDFGRYWWQISDWVERFGKEAIGVNLSV